MKKSLIILMFLGSFIYGQGENKNSLYMENYINTVIVGTSEKLEFYDTIITYPKIYSVVRDENMYQLNNLIREDVIKVIKWYESYNDEDTIENLDLNIKFEIVLLNKNLVSIEYYGLGELEGAAHPDKIFYTTNIDLNTLKKLKLKDIINVNKDFVEYFLKNFKYIGPLGDEDVGKNISKEFGDSEYLLESFVEADSVGESSVYSYFTKKGLVITVPVNHAIGGYAELELDYKTLYKYLKPSIKKYF